MNRASFRLMGVFVFVLTWIITAFLVADFKGLPKMWWRPDVLSSLSASTLIGVLAISLAVATVVAPSAYLVLMRSRGLTPQGAPTGIFKLNEAMELMESAEQDFFQKFKVQQRQGYYPLIEDIQSKQSLEEEAKFLRTDPRTRRAINCLLEAIKIEESAGAAEVDPALQLARVYNAANAHLKLGRVRRFSRDWDNAVQELDRAISDFHLLLVSAHPSNSLAELSTAYLTLGEVNMARYRASSSEGHRAAARRAFAESMRLDQLSNTDFSNTKKLDWDLETATQRET